MDFYDYNLIRIRILSSLEFVRIKRTALKIRFNIYKNQSVCLYGVTCNWNTAIEAYLPIVDAANIKNPFGVQVNEWFILDDFMERNKKSKHIDWRHRMNHQSYTGCQYERWGPNSHAQKYWYQMLPGPKRRVWKLGTLSFFLSAWLTFNISELFWCVVDKLVHSHSPSLVQINSWSRMTWRPWSLRLYVFCNMQHQ